MRRRANELADFVEAARKHYGIAAPVALGYSNGANIAAAMLLLRPEVLAGAVLLRAMVPLSTPAACDPVRQAGPDRLRPARSDHSGQQLGQACGIADARQAPPSQHRTLPTGHQLSQADLTIAGEWMRTVPLAQAAA